MSEFTPHGYVTISNHGGYLVEISNDGEAARIKDSFGSDNPEISDWLEIEHIYDEESDDVQMIIAPDSYNINLADVMRINPMN